MAIPCILKKRFFLLFFKFSKVIVEMLLHGKMEHSTPTKERESLQAVGVGIVKPLSLSLTVCETDMIVIHL